MARAGACPCATWANAPRAGGDIPASFAPADLGLEYIERHVDIPMRDGVSLHAVIIIAKGLSHAPAMLIRTPYNAEHLKDGSAGGVTLESRLSTYLSELARAGYVIVAEDVRGKHHSGGDFIMTAPLNPGGVDESTDAYDTIDWLATHLAEGNGRVGLIGTSYSGYTALMSLVASHPALGAVVAMNPMVDGWRGDDWFHNGAFRQEMMRFIFKQTATKDSSQALTVPYQDDYAAFLDYGSAGALGRMAGMDQLPFWRKLTEHPNYDRFWRDQAVDQVLAGRSSLTPTLLVASQWDQEDAFGAFAVWAALKPRLQGQLHLVVGPWHHGQEEQDGSSLGSLDWGSDTAEWFRRNVLIPFLDAHLKADAGVKALAPVTAFETGTNQWRYLPDWPLACSTGCPSHMTPYMLGEKGNLTSGAAPPGGGEFDEFISDPKRPVPYTTLPARPPYQGGSDWQRWLVSDQRFAATRPDVLVYASPVLTHAVHIVGAPIARITASTSGSDSDWVVKLIDAYPQITPDHADMGGYQLAVSLNLLRGRFRKDPAHPEPVPSRVPIQYDFSLPSVDHVFLPGHRIMIQIQSSLFPLYDRNPQTFVDNIFFAKPGDYKAQTQRVYHSAAFPSLVDLPVVADKPDQQIR